MAFAAQPVFPTAIAKIFSLKRLVSYINGDFISISANSTASTPATSTTASTLIGDFVSGTTTTTTTTAAASPSRHIYNPWTMRIMIEQQDATQDDVDTAVSIAVKAQEKWAATPAAKRAQILRNAAVKLRELNVGH